VDDIRFTAGLLGMSDAARYLGIPRQTFHRWARGYERGAPLLHVLEPQRSREARVTLIAVAEAWVLTALRDAGVRPHERPYEYAAYQAARVHMFLLPGEATRGDLVDLVAGSSKSICTTWTRARTGIWRIRPSGLHPL
jgi:Putative DNA-binding HTH domain